MKAALKNHAPGTAGRLIFELLIVFVGVYAAFWVDNYREELADRDRAREIALSIQRGLDDVIEAESSFVNLSSAGMAAWQAARERGELVAPFFFRVNGSERAPIQVYEAIIQSRPAELFDADLVFDLAAFYGELSGRGDRYIRYAEFTESELLPNLKRDSSVFYESNGSRLRPEYEAHMDRLRELIEMWSGDVARASSLKLQLEPYIE